MHSSRNSLSPGILTLIINWEHDHTTLKGSRHNWSIFGRGSEVRKMTLHFGDSLDPRLWSLHVWVYTWWWWMWSRPLLSRVRVSYGLEGVSPSSSSSFPIPPLSARVLPGESLCSRPNHPRATSSPGDRGWDSSFSKDNRLRLLFLFK